MATSRSRRVTRETNTRRGRNAMNIQRKINSDYEALVRDYGKLFAEIWRIPVTKYVLGGAALAALIPFAGKFLENNPDLKDRFSRFIPRYSDLDTINP